MWSTKHHGPTVRRRCRGSARRTPTAPTWVSWLSVISRSPTDTLLVTLASGIVFGAVAVEHGEDLLGG